MYFTNWEFGKTPEHLPVECKKTEQTHRGNMSTKRVFLNAFGFDELMCIRAEHYKSNNAAYTSIYTSFNQKRSLFN